MNGRGSQQNFQCWPSGPCPSSPDDRPFLRETPNLANRSRIKKNSGKYSRRSPMQQVTTEKRPINRGISGSSAINNHITPIKFPKATRIKCTNLRSRFRITIVKEALVSSRDLTNCEDRAIDRGPASRAIKKSTATNKARDSIYLPQSVLIAANRTISSRVPSSWQHASRLIPSCM